MNAQQLGGPPLVAPRGLQGLVNGRGPQSGQIHVGQRYVDPVPPVRRAARCGAQSSTYDCSMTCDNCRTLPGQANSQNRFSVSGSGLHKRPLISGSAKRREKKSISSGISSTRLRSGRDLQFHHIQAVIEILAKAALGDFDSKSRFVAAMICTLIGTGWAAPTGVTSRCCNTRSNLGWSSSGISPTSSRKTVPPSAARNTPAERPAAPVKEPFSCPNSWLSANVTVSAAQLTGMNGLAAARAAMMNNCAPEFFAGAGFARNEHGAIGLGGALGVSRNLANGRILSQHPVGGRRAGAATLSMLGAIDE